MRKLIIIGFVGLYLLSMLKPMLPYLDYVINYERISTELCENKDKPELECYGKCHLQKEVAKVIETEKDPAVPTFKKVVEDYYISESNLISLAFIKTTYKNTFLRSDFKILNGFSGDILDPPQA